MGQHDKLFPRGSNQHTFGHSSHLWNWCSTWEQQCLWVYYLPAQYWPWLHKVRFLLKQVKLMSVIFWFLKWSMLVANISMSACTDQWDLHSAQSFKLESHLRLLQGPCPRGAYWGCYCSWDSSNRNIICFCPLYCCKLGYNQNCSGYHSSIVIQLRNF